MSAHGEACRRQGARRERHDRTMSHFISEDDLKTFEGWLGYQGYDLTMLALDDLAKWRELFDEISKRPDSKVGLMKLGSSVPGDRIYGVAVRDSGLWLVGPAFVEI